MNALKKIFTVFTSVAMATSMSFAHSNCDYEIYRNLHKQECAKHDKKTAQSDSTLLAVLGGAALAGIGISIANQGSGDSGAHGSTNNNFNTSIQRSTNVSINYSLTDTVQNYQTYDSYVSQTDSNDIDSAVINGIKSADWYERNSKQYDRINLAWSIARDFTGKNTNIAVVDDMNDYHGHSVKDIVSYIAPDANITTQNIAKGNGFQSFDEIANTINSNSPADIYNNSWQREANQYQNAATAIYNGTTTKTYQEAQQYMYSVTSVNFVNEIINKSIDNDSIFVWAAGNESYSESGVISALPLAFPEIQGHFVNVVAFDTRKNELAWYSNQCGITQNYCITAPGSSIQTDSHATKVSGTSFAAPIVSGAIATIKEAFPYMSATEITALLFTTADDLGTPGVDEVYGWGMLDMEKATRPVGAARIVMSNNTVQPLEDSNVGGMAGAAIKKAGIKLAFVDDFGRAFTTNLSDNINVIPYGRGFEKLQNDDNNSIAISNNVEFGFKQNKFLESTGLIQNKQNNLTNFFGYKNEFEIGDLRFYQTARLGMTAPHNEDNNSIISGLSSIYTTSIKTGVKWNDFSFEIAMPETIIHGNAYMNIPVARANNGVMIYDNAQVNLKTKPSTEYTITYKSLSATYVNNPEYQDEFYILAKGKINF